LHCWLAVWWVDPDCSWLERRFWRLIDEALGVLLEGLVEGCLTGSVYLISLAVVSPVRRHQADAEVMMVIVVPVEEVPAEGLGALLNATPAAVIGSALIGPLTK